jgi:hypothetical protein
MGFGGVITVSCNNLNTNCIHTFYKNFSVWWCLWVFKYTLASYGHSGLMDNLFPPISLLNESLTIFQIKYFFFKYILTSFLI